MGMNYDSERSSIRSGKGFKGVVAGCEELGDDEMGFNSLVGRR
jgi:hypothetical protein